MNLYDEDDAYGVIAAMDNDLDDGLNPPAKVTFSRRGGAGFELTLTPYDDAGNCDDARAEKFVGVITHRA